MVIRNNKRGIRFVLVVEWSSRSEIVLSTEYVLIEAFIRTVFHLCLALFSEREIIILDCLPKISWIWFLEISIGVVNKYERKQTAGKYCIYIPLYRYIQTNENINF